MILISVPSLGVYYCQQLTLSVCPMSVRLFVMLLQIASFFFVSRWNRAIFWLSFLHVPLYKTLFDFWFRPTNAQNLLPKICTKSHICRLVWQIDRRCLGLPGGFQGRPIQRNRTKCCGIDLCCHGNEISARCGDPVTYRLVICENIYIYIQLPSVLSCWWLSDRKIIWCVKVLLLQRFLNLFVAKWVDWTITECVSVCDRYVNVHMLTAVLFSLQFIW